jgi:hypothetical protein
LELAGIPDPGKISHGLEAANSRFLFTPETPITSESPGGYTTVLPPLLPAPATKTMLAANAWPTALAIPASK